MRPPTPPRFPLAPCLWVGFAFLCSLLPDILSGATRQVVVYSFVTEAGRTQPPPSMERPQRCRLGSRGYRELGALRAREVPAKLEQVDPLVRRALGLNGYVPLKAGESADVVVVFSWGCIRPDHERRDGSTGDRLLNQAEVLDMVGGRALPRITSRMDQLALVDAAMTERYFLVVSGFTPSSYAQRTNELLWQTQVSLPSNGLSQEQAMPVLASAAAPLLGVETTVPLFVAIDVERALRSPGTTDPR